MESDLIKVKEIMGCIENEMPVNVASRIRRACGELENGNNLAVSIDKTIQKLGEISEDPNIDAYSKTIIWDILSKLESNG